jgi:hypothetical protein
MHLKASQGKKVPEIQCQWKEAGCGEGRKPSNCLYCFFALQKSQKTDKLKKYAFLYM